MSLSFKSKSCLLALLCSIGLIASNSASASSAPVSAERANIIAKKNHINPHVLKLALKSYAFAARQHRAKRPVLAIVDYTRPSATPRLWVINLQTDRIVDHVLVAHGKNSGGFTGQYYSNNPNSYQSSVGTIVTGNDYYGSYGHAMHLYGLEKGINNHMAARHIVLHSQWYVTPTVAREHGEVGKSHGCLVVNPAKVDRIIHELKGGAVIFAYGQPEDHDPYIS